MKLAFFLALFGALFGTALVPHWHVMAFAPFLAITYQRNKLLGALWLALICGLIMDLITSQFRMGMFSLNYLLTTLLLFSQRRHFFEDKSLAISLYSALISFVSSLIHFFLLFCMGNNPAFSLKFFMADLLVMPLFDAVYALVWFIGPIKFCRYLQRTGWRKIFFKEE